MRSATPKLPHELLFQSTSFVPDADPDADADACSKEAEEEEDVSSHDDFSLNNSLLEDDEPISNMTSPPPISQKKSWIRSVLDTSCPSCRCSPTTLKTCTLRSRRPKTRRRWILWLGGTALLVAGLVGGLSLADSVMEAETIAAPPGTGDVDAKTNTNPSTNTYLSWDADFSAWSRKRHDAPVLVYSSSKDQQVGVVASIRSVQMHASGPVEFLYIGESPLPRMEDMPRVRYRQLSQIVEKYKLKQFGNPFHSRSGKNSKLNTEPANYVRFVLHELFPKQDKVMWIDADTIVECDVVQLFNNTFASKSKKKAGKDALKTLPAIAAVPRDGWPTGLTVRGRKIYWKLHGKEEQSFNAGVYLVELNRWRAQHLTYKVRGFAHFNERENLYSTGSQPPLALAVGGNFEHLPKSWNVKMRYADVVNGTLHEEICLMHWSGPNKPWEHHHEDEIHSNLWRTYGTPPYDETAD